MGRSQLAVVIPCHNEAATLAAVVEGARRSGDVIVVDDRSSDDSGALATGRGATVIPAETPGYDGAIDTGLRYAHAQGYAYVVTMDADGEHDPGLVAAFLARFEAGAELICGVRPSPQRASEYIVAAVGLGLFGVRDLLCGMKGYARPVLAAYLESGAPLLVNMTPAVLWRKRGGAFLQVPVTGERRDGRPRFARALKANWAILKAFARVVSLSATPTPPPIPIAGRSDFA